MAEKIYVGNAKRFGDYGQIKVSFKLADVQQYVNDKGYVNLVIAERKEVGKYGETHTVTIDTWKPKQKDNDPTSAW